MQDRRRIGQLQSVLMPSVLPVLTIDRLENAVPLAQALVDGGLLSLEITLRTRDALSALSVIAGSLPEVRVGAGTIRSPEQAEAAINAGAQFLVSPGMTPRLIEAAQHWPVPFLPGAATASEAMALADLGYCIQKFFPASASGGPDTLKSLAAPLADIQFCPTGGIDAANAHDYLVLPNVICVGGSWVAPQQAIERGDWSTITTLAQNASALGQR
ncbi:MAG: bifunctional 4-hydroxy-2-oxoglutarate aldolase/2-dehydro-3-deoxy-phosphogluconate aldolase [Hyphomicrobiaceae bacterium]